MWCLYLVTNLTNGKQYVGITNIPTRRWREHVSGHGSKLLKQAMAKYGISNFDFDILCYMPEHTVKQFEAMYIKGLNTVAPFGYNLTEGGEGSTGWIPSDATRRKMSEAHSGKNNGMFGKRHTKKARDKISFRAKQRKLMPSENYSRPGSSNPRARRVLVDGIEFGCIKDAAEYLGVNASHLRTKFSRFNKSNNWPEDWAYL
jgi:group I intron endonuclease